jgi:hypothetical protein
MKFDLPNVNWKLNLSIYVNLCLFDSSISDTYS